MKGTIELALACALMLACAVASSGLLAIGKFAWIFL